MVLEFISPRKGSDHSKEDTLLGNDTVLISKLRDKDGLTMAVALDLGIESQEVKLLAEELSSWKLKPDRTFRNIQVYLPGS